MTRPVLIVTGGGRGIGAAVAANGAQRGYDVCFSYRRDDRRAAEVVAAVTSAGGRAQAVKSDMSSEEGVEKLFRHCDEAFGAPDVLVNNAAVLGPKGRLADISLSALREVFDTNITGYFLCAREAVRRMTMAAGGRGGAIINVSSRSATLGGAGEWVQYAASKGAIDTMTIGLAREVAAEGIRVNAIRPGLIETEMHGTAGDSDRTARLGPRLPMKRAGTVQEVAATVLWLASSEASYVSGALLDVAGAR